MDSHYLMYKNIYLHPNFQNLQYIYIIVLNFQLFFIVFCFNKDKTNNSYNQIYFIFIFTVLYDSPCQLKFEWA